MKSKSILIHLATTLTATVLTIGPVALPAADHAPATHRAPCAVSGSAPQCALPTRAPDRRTAGSRDASGADVASAVETTSPSASEQNDLAGALLEDLVRKDHRPELDL